MKTYHTGKNIPDPTNFIKRAELKHNKNYDYSNLNYINYNTKVSITCKRCGNILLILPNNHLKRGGGCNECSIKERKLPQNTKRSNEWFLSEAHKKYEDKFTYLNEYEGSYSLIKIRCNHCNNEYTQKAIGHLNGKGGCKKCKFNNLPQNKAISVEEFEKKCKEIHNNRYCYIGDYKNSKSNVTVVCSKHGSFKQNANAHLNDKQGCPKCGRSKAEEIISNWLSENKIDFVEQKKFPKCKNRRELPFDFYLTEKNICLEYDGYQHHNDCKWFGGEKGFVYRQKNDKIKNDFCISNGIKLIRIKQEKISNYKNLESYVINQLISLPLLMIE